jgi:histone deacetylase complex regulatory component SIN3
MGQPSLMTGQEQLAHDQEPTLNDALIYLDQVKTRFSEQPDIYNRFMDIMQEFKREAIGTPSVIEKVQSLFNGYPTLIEGFNAFLPDGYRIEDGIEDNPDAIRVTTPSEEPTKSLLRADTAGATARLQNRRQEKDTEAFAASALAEAKKHSQSPTSETERPINRGESWHMTYLGEWRVENEEGAYETRYQPSVNEQDIHESGLMLETTSKGRTLSTQDCFFRKDMEKQGIA